MEAEAVAGLNISHGVHPGMVAQDFGVHLRTVFRWIKKGFLKSKNGRINSEYKTTSLSDWKRSCWFHEARGKEMLDISNGTMTAWKKRKLLETISVMGLERVLLSSIERIVKRRKSGTFSLHPTHSLPHLILEITGVGHPTLKDALDNGEVPSELVDGVRMIPNEEVARIKKEWISSCRPIGAQNILGKNKSTIGRWVNIGKLATVVVLGQLRIVLKGVAKTSEERQRLKIYLYKEKQKYRRRANAGIKVYKKQQRIKKAKERQKIKTKQSNDKIFRAKRMDLSSQPPRRVAVQIPDYTPQQVKVRGFESRRLTTCEEAAKATGKGVDYINELFRTGKTIRGEVVDDKVFIYLLSLETLIVKLKQGRTF